MPVPRISKEELKLKLDSGTPPVIVDVRLKYPYEHSTVKLPGAVRQHPKSFDPASLPRDREIVLYDSDPDELVSAPLVAELLRRGYRAAALKGGINDWITAKLPTDTKEAPQAAPPAPGSLRG